LSFFLPAIAVVLKETRAKSNVKRNTFFIVLNLIQIISPPLMKGRELLK
jgi:hypothetical protein